MEGVDPNDDSLIELPVDDGTKRGAGPPRGRASGGRARPILMAIAIAVLGLVGANLLLADDPDGAEEAAADDNPFTGFPAALDAIPDAAYTDLTDGQIVPYELDSLPFSVGTVTVMCVGDVDPAARTLLDECDSGTAQRRTTSPGGVLEAEITVFRQIAVAGFRRVDCAEQACELRTYADKAPGVVVGRAMLEWASIPAERLGPQISVEAEDPLVFGSPLSVVGTGFPADTEIQLQPCRFGGRDDADPLACKEVLADETIRTGADGSFRHDDLADWEIPATGGTVTCADLLLDHCAMTVAITGAERQPAAVPLTIVADRFADAVVELPETFIVSQTEGLVDGDVVEITADDWFYSSQLELVICSAAEPLDCTWLSFGRPVLAGVELPRSFVTFRGTRHDCVEDGPCVLAVFSFRDPEQRLEVPISFDPEAPLQEPTPLTVTPTTGLQDWSLLTVDFDDLVSVPLVTVCATGEPLDCQGLETESTTGTQLITRVRTLLETPAGLHNCVTDGPCELVIWDAAELTRFQTTPLEFAPVEERPLIGVVRPAAGVRNGETVQVAVGNAVDDVSVSMCPVDGFCVPLVVTETTGGRATFTFTAVQRFEVLLDDGTVQKTDCAVDACEIRISDGWASDRMAIAFDDSPAPVPALAVEAVEPLPLDEIFTVRGRDFTPTIQPSEIRLLLCPPWAELDSSCVRIGTVSTRRLPADGTFEVPVNIPSSAFTTGFQNAMDRCARECVLVARPLLGEATRLPVIRSTSPP